MSKRTIIFGEILLRFSPLNHLRLTQAASSDLYYGYPEAYVTASLSKFGFPVKFVTFFSSNELGRISLTMFDFFGVDSLATIQEKRLAIYSFKQRASKSSGEVICKEYLEVVNKMSLTILGDLNYRPKLCKTI